ncbi:MAG TPA: NAD(P)H-dependent oxidoreductase subunit E [Bacteroidales bacterium]|jgi:NADH-quinone oxidoreductase subunit E|nr:NAD(P)H-dependent oxidoreductase subunit E [Bacteroidales bacterium]HQB37589.1 NAD(P)H-dependent oxidoreductase subunit E [Bacteroidales bacterium]
MNRDIDIDTILKKYKPGRRDELIPLMQEIQEVYGHLSEEAVVKIGTYVGLSTTKIYGLATFYDQFRFVPAGKIRITVCHGTSCSLNGSKAVINNIREFTGLQPGQTSRDGIFSYEIATCMGGCNNGPVLSINDEYYPHIKPEQIPELLNKLKFIIEND